MNKEEFILNIRPANGEPSKEYVMRLNTKLLLENEQLQQKVNQLETNIDEAIEYVDCFDIKILEEVGEHLAVEIIKKMFSLLERGKE